MIEIKKIEGPSGIPIYYQAMPDIVKSVSLSWVIFTGAADDESVGSPGLYHWFEHVPFRGTVKYPGGYAQTKGLLTKRGGSNGATTNMYATRYWGFTPLAQWQENLSLITDLFARPLITDEAVEAERLVINNEIVGKRSDARESNSDDLNEILYGGHPFGHIVVGTEESLKTMDADALRQAHKAGYDRSRSALFVVGNVPEGELIRKLETLVSVIPDNGLSPRSMSADFGKRPWPKKRVVEVGTMFKSSMVYVLFPFDAGSPAKNSHAGRILRNLFSFGTGSSPLYRIIREQRNLVYQTWIEEWYGTGGGMFGFAAQCKTENVQAVIQGFRDVFIDAEARSTERLQTVKAGIKGRMDMMAINPDRIADEAIRRLTWGATLNDSDIVREVDEVTHGDVGEYFNLLDPEKACTVIFEGIT